MGQYRQWLHYREVDQQLRAQHELLIQELTRLQEQMGLPQAPLLDASNVIVQALTLQQAETSLADLPLPPPEASSENGRTTVAPERGLQASSDDTWLPDLDASDVPSAPQSVFPLLATNAYAPLPPIPHGDMNLLPEDMAAFLNEQARTDPQLTLPWWLRKAALSAAQGTPLDQQSIRTNRLVQRWLERWGRQTEQSSQPLQSSRPVPPSGGIAQSPGKPQEDI